MTTSDEKVHKIIDLGKCDENVYDIETECHFSCGFPLIVHITDSFVLSMNTKDIIGDLRNLEDLFDFSNINRDHEFFSNKNEKVIGSFKIETPENI